MANFINPKNIVLEKKINGNIEYVYPKTLGDIVYVTDPTVENATVNGESLNTVLTNINTSLEATGNAIQTVAYENGVIKFYKEKSSDVVSGTTAAAFSINVPKEQFLDDSETYFEPNFVYEGSDYEVNDIDGFSDALDGHPVLILAIKTIAENGTSTIKYVPIDLHDMIKTYSGVAQDATHPVGISIDAEGKISATLGIKDGDNALKIDSATGKLYVEDLSIANGTTGGAVVQDANGKMADSGIVVKTGTETLETTAQTLVGAINELNEDITFGYDGQVTIETDKTVGTDTYDFYFNVDHVDADKIESIKHADDTSVSTAGQILVTTADGKLVASTIAIDSIGSTDVIAQKANKVEDAVEGNLAKLDEDGDLVDSGISTDDLSDVIEAIGDITTLDTDETIVGALKELQAEVAFDSDDDSIKIEADADGFDLSINLEGLNVQTGAQAQKGEYSSSVDSLVGALNEVKNVADTAALAAAGCGANIYLATGASLPATVDEYDLIMQEI